MPLSLSTSINESERMEPLAQAKNSATPCKVVVIWIDWYAYHIARLEGLRRHPDLADAVVGIEMVGGAGVHTGWKFKEAFPPSLPVDTLMPEADWSRMNQIRLAFTLWHRLDSLNPEAVMIPGYYTLPAIAAALWTKLKGRKAVLMTESTAHDQSRQWWREGLKRLLVNTLFQWAISGGQPQKNYLLRLGFPASRIFGSYDVVDNDFFCRRCFDLRTTANPCDLGLPSDYFLYVGRISEEKNVKRLIDAYAEYRDSGGTWALVLVGDGPDLASIQKQVHKRRFHDSILMPGLKTTSRLPDYYAFAKTFILPSTREPWGLVVNEAMACSLPVLVSQRCGCASDLVEEGENGYTFDPFEPSAISGCMLQVSGLPAETLADMGKRSREIILRFSPDAFASAVSRILTQ